MTIATTRNLTILGILTIVGALATGATQFFQGGIAAVNVEALVTAIGAGIGMILAKGAQSTGGTVNGAGVPVVDPSPPVPAK